MEIHTGELRLFAFSQAPSGWLSCNGDLLTITDYPLLFDEIGTAYGGDGTTQFGLPDLRGRVPVCVNDTYQRGQKIGTQGNVLGAVPSHTHSLNVMNADGSKSSPGGEMAAARIGTAGSGFYAASGSVSLATETIAQAGSASPEPVSNAQPTLGLGFGICYDTSGNDEPYIGEIRMIGFTDHIPRNWAACDGAFYPVGTYPVLYQVLGTRFGSKNNGGDFALPDLRGRAPIGAGQGAGLPNQQVGQQGGKETTLIHTTSMPAHTHAVQASDTVGTGGPAGNYFAGPSGAAAGASLYADNGDAPALVALDADTVGETGDGSTLSTMQPYLAVQFIICITGLYPVPGEGDAS
ncbi:MAG: hypothetical protein EP335_16930 [Alphaproteobacteria bacterium]|nr:MAG: hypothetical protein EP335_16930 [Alphaproteobacteria bacterium]